MTAVVCGFNWEITDGCYRATRLDYKAFIRNPILFRRARFNQCKRSEAIILGRDIFLRLLCRFAPRNDSVLMGQILLLRGTYPRRHNLISGYHLGWYPLLLQRH